MTYLKADLIMYFQLSIENVLRIILDTSTVTDV